MKNVEWLKENIGELPNAVAVFVSEGKQYADTGIPVLSVYDLIDQLDEPEILSQKFINEKAVEVYADTADAEVHAVFRMRDLQNLLVPTLSKTETVADVIPKFVADWIEVNKQFEEKWNDYSKEDAMNDTIHFTIYGLFADYPATNSHVELRKPVLRWLSVDRGNYFKLVNAVRYGYEVEEEQKYYVLNKNNKLMLRKYTRGVRELDISNSMTIDSEFFEFERFALTEQEIKDYDERYFAFAKPVEEVE